jgi:hypothetical protein
VADDEEVSAVESPGLTVAAAQTSIGQTYERPRVFDLGKVRRVTRGNSAAGHSDANSQYYR